MRPILPAAAVVLLSAVVLPAPAAAQATRDQARIVITVAPGYIIGNDLWSVRGQPLVDTDDSGPVVDPVNLSREIRPTFGVAFAGAYYPGDHVGFVAEALLLGLGYSDRCRPVGTMQSARNALACEAIDGGEKAASAVALTGGVVYRIHSRRTIAPYARANLGLVLSSQSSIRTTARINPANDGITESIDVPVYRDARDTRLTPAIALGLGFTAALAPGYQLRWELRDNITGVHVVDGPTVVSAVEPETSVEFRHLIGMTIGLDVVLERRRGRRY